MTHRKLQHSTKEFESQMMTSYFKWKVFSSLKMTVVHHISCSFLALSAVQDEDMRSHKNEFNVHSFPHFPKTSPTDETQSRRQRPLNQWKSAQQRRHTNVHTKKAPNTNWSNEKEIKIPNVSKTISASPLAAGLICQVCVCGLNLNICTRACRRKQERAMALSSRYSATHNYE